MLAIAESGADSLVALLLAAISCLPGESLSCLPFCTPSPSPAVVLILRASPAALLLGPEEQSRCSLPGCCPLSQGTYSATALADSSQACGNPSCCCGEWLQAALKVEELQGDNWLSSCAAFWLSLHVHVSAGPKPPAAARDCIASAVLKWRTAHVSSCSAA